MRLKTPGASSLNFWISTLQLTNVQTWPIGVQWNYPSHTRDLRATMTWIRSLLPSPCSCCIQYLPARHGRSFTKQVEGSEAGRLLSAQSPIEILDIHDFSQDLTHFLVQVKDFTPFLTRVDGAQAPATEYETTHLLHTQAVERTVKTVTVDSSLLLGARQGGEAPSHTDPNTSTSLPGLQLGAGLTFLPMYGMATTNF